MPPRICRALYATALLLLLFWIVGDGLRLPYLSDDFDHAHYTAEIRAGLRPLADLWRPFHGQFVILLRLLFWFGTLDGGMDATWVRVGALLAHAAGALGCALLAARWTGSAPAGALAGLLFAGAAGFIGEVLYWPSTAIFPLGSALWILALAALSTNRWKPRARLALSLAAFAASTLGLNAQALAGFGLAAYCGMVLPTDTFWRRRAPVVFAAAAVALAAFWRLLPGADEWSAFALSWRALSLGGWLVATAPLRFLFSWIPMPAPDLRTVAAGSAVAWILLLAALRPLDRAQRRILLALWIPAVLLALAAGAARAPLSGTFRYGPGYLYGHGRYYYAFLLPLAVHAAFLAARVRRPRTAAVVLAVACVAVLGSRQHYRRGVPHAGYAAIEQALGRARTLARTIQASAERLPAPVTLADGLVPLDGVHRNAVSMAFVIYAEYPGGLRNVRLTRGPVWGRAAEFQNAVLAGWPVRVENGRLESTRAGPRIDFSLGSMEESLVRGFSWWEKPFRWMGEEAAVRLRRAPGALVITAYAPVDRLPGNPPIDVRVTVDSAPVGGFTVAGPGVREYRVPCPPEVARGGGPALVTLRAGRVWHGRDIDPLSFDERDLSVAISSIGFEGAPR